MKFKSKKASAFAPATVANVAVGFDILGFALETLGENVTVETLAEPIVVLNPVENYPELSLDPKKNTATAGLLRLIQEKKLKHGFQVTIHKSIAIGSGLGGSSMSAVAAIVAANALLKKKLTQNELLDYALTGEEVASGSRHGDNVAPCLMGGLVFVRSHPELDVQKIKTPSSLRCVVLFPELSIKTEEARNLLNPNVHLKAMIEQTANLTGFLIGCLNNDFNLMKKSLKDAVIEPQRKKLIPHFDQLKESAMSAGALGCSISGSGPTIFALAKNQKEAVRIQKNFLQTAVKHNLSVRGCWISAISKKGAHLVKTSAKQIVKTKLKKTGKAK